MSLQDYPVIPMHLLLEPRWVAWRALGDKKPPVGDDGRPAQRWTAPPEWLDYEKAAERAGLYPNSGVGIILGKNISGIDMDNCLDPVTHRLHPFADMILFEQAVGCYAEVSPSGTGIKIFGRSQLPGIELHFKGDGAPTLTKTFPPDHSFFAITGDCINTEALGDLTAVLRFWCAAPREETKTASLPEVVDQGGRNNTLFREGCRLRRLGYEESEILGALRAINTNRCHPPLDAREVEGIARSCAKYEPALDTFPTTEAGDAEFFAQCTADAVRYDHRRGRWLLFSEHHWRPQTDGEIHRLALEGIRARQRAAVGNKDRMRWAIGGEARKRQSNMLALAQSMVPLADAGDDWDTDPWLLGVQNGVIDLRTGQLRSGLPEDRITMQARTVFDPDANCPLWDKTVTEIFGGDTELISYFDRLIGYSLTGDCREEVLAFCWGGGANGKGTVMNTIAWLLGDYADDLPFSALELHERSGIPNDIAKIVGKRFVTSSESGEARRLNEARVKALTGRDPITARFLRREFFTFQPVAKFWLATNHKPMVRDTSVGFWRRIHLIPFTQSFASNPDLQLKDKLRAEAAGIVARGVRGCLAWQQEGLKPPAVVQEATSAYRAESTPLCRFLEARCVVKDEAQATFGQLYEAYSRWCSDVREPSRLTRREFSDELHERFKTVPDERKQAVKFIGVGLVGYGGEGLLS
jgi:putative DNA primase/helicase